jgi:hypothetical protein
LEQRYVTSSDQIDDDVLGSHISVGILAAAEKNTAFTIVFDGTRER